MNAEEMTCEQYQAEMVKSLMFVVENGDEVTCNGWRIWRDGRDENDRVVYCVHRTTDEHEFFDCQQAVSFYMTGVNVLLIKAE